MAIKNFSTTPFIFFTAFSESKEVAAAIMMGANDYVVKPFDADYLLTIVTKHLK